MQNGIRSLALLLLLALAAPFFVSASAWAAVDLVTVPRREGTQLTIYNSEDITMVRENRLLTVKKGANRIQFSWANTLIDPTSIDFRILDQVDQVDLLDTTFPAGRNDALQWNITSQIDGKIPVEIRYFTSGITWKADYVGIANADETKLNVTGYVRVINNSGELYDNAETRMVVGKINLVEKIAELARRPAPGSGPIGFKGKPHYSMNGLFLDAVKECEELDCDEMVVPCEDPACNMPAKPKKVVKQGLSEYFLFAIDGREDIKNGEPKRLVSMEVADVPLECVYKLSDRGHSGAFTKYYRFKNKKITDESTGEELDLPAMENLGLSPLPDGNVRLYSEYANKDLAYVGGTVTKYVPIGDRLKVAVGQDPDLTIKKQVIDKKITNVHAHRYRKITSHTHCDYYDLIDYDETVYYEEEIISGKPSLAKLEVERRFGANVVLWGSEGKPEDWDKDEPSAYVDLHEIGSRVERVDANHVKYFVDLEPGEKRTIRYSVTYKQRMIAPKLNAISHEEHNRTIPADQSKTGPEPRNPFPTL